MQTSFDTTPLTYQHLDHQPWRPMVRLMALAAVGQGFASVFIFAAHLHTYVESVRVALLMTRQFATFLELVIVAVTAGQLAGGLLAVRYRLIGRTVILWSEAVYIGLCVFRGAYNYVDFCRQFNAWKLSYAISSVAGLLGELVMPLLIWTYFRRPEVRAVFEG